DWVIFPRSWQIHALHYGLKLRIFPSVAGYHLGFDKIQMTRAFWSFCPQHIPHTLILPNNPNGREQVLDEMTFPLVLKDARNSMGRGVFLVESPAEFRKITAYREILYVQEYLPIDEDLRIVVVGDKVAGEFGLDYAGFDVAMVEGHPFLLEFNLLFGNQVLNARGIRLGPLIVEYLEQRLAAGLHRSPQEAPPEAPFVHSGQPPGGQL
ncbi:MAG: ATP-grasp domain-containing protein, partial [Gammaproteobacteria bacterium]